MKTFISILLFLLTFNVFADSIHASSETGNKIESTAIENQLNKMETLLQQSIARADSLERELLLFKSKDDFFSVGIAEISAIYGVLFAIMVFFAGYFTINKFKDQIEKFKNDVEEHGDSLGYKYEKEQEVQNKKIEKVITDHEWINTKLDLASSYSFITIASISAEKSEDFNCFYYSLLGTGSFLRYIVHQNDTTQYNLDILSNNMRRAFDSLNKVQAIDSSMLSAQINTVRNEIDYLITCRFDNVSNLAAKIKLLLAEKIN